MFCHRKKPQNINIIFGNLKDMKCLKKKKILHWHSNPIERYILLSVFSMYFWHLSLSWDLRRFIVQSFLYWQDLIKLDENSSKRSHSVEILIVCYFCFFQTNKIYEFTSFWHKDELEFPTQSFSPISKIFIKNIFPCKHWRLKDKGWNKISLNE